MARINDLTTFPNTTPALDDHVLGTDVSETVNSADGESVTFKFEDIRGLFGGFNKDQTWSDVSGSRSVGTSYQNTSGAAIQVAVDVSVNYGAGTGSLVFEVSTDDATWVTVSSAVAAASASVQSAFIVPATQYYRVRDTASGSPVINSWAELS